MIVFIILYLVLLLAIVYLLKGFEFFTPQPFIEMADAEFRGINLLGVNSTDGNIPFETVVACRDMCERNSECKGYSFYHPGQRCFMFMSGDFVPQRPGFYSGKKV